MRIIDAILAADRMRHNEIDPAVKLQWLSELDGRIWQELFAQHAGAGEEILRCAQAPSVTSVRTGDSSLGEGAVDAGTSNARSGGAFRGYGEDTDVEAVRLLVGPPYEELYPRWLVMQIDLAHGEIDRYNNSAAVFSALYKQYASWFTRSFMPLQRVAGLRF